MDPETPETGLTEARSEDERRALVDRALREHGDLGVYGDLRGGLEALEQDMHVRITHGDGWLHLEAWPRSGRGHDFSLEIHPTTLEISESVVGEIAPDPEEEP